MRFSKEFFKESHELVLAKPKYKKTDIYKDLKCPIYNYLLALQSEASQITAARVLQAVARRMGRQSVYEIRWEKFNATALNTLISTLKNQDNLSPKTISLYVSIVKQVIEHTYLLGYMSALQRDAIKMIKANTGSRTKEYTLLDRNGVEGFLSDVAESGSDNISKLRDLAIFSILTRCGLRRQEVVNLKVNDVGIAALRVIGKGNKQRNVALHPVVLEAINNWLAVYNYTDNNSPLFVSILKGGHLQNKALSADAIFKLCAKYKSPPPHSLRRSYATNLYQNGVKIKNISKMLGHNQIATTELYLRVGDDEVFKDVMDKLL
ncbi:MAG: tyrosine-type recombinase/integrase [Pseudoalteromonas distincta]